MTSAERFVLIVQTAAVVEDIQGGRTLAGAVVSQAALLAERFFPHGTISPERAASDLIEWNYGRTGPPDWWTREVAEWLTRESR
jgi:hypothetical protein